MPTYKLTYFNTRGRAETARMLFKMAGQEFEDIRVDQEAWLELKPKTTMGHLPILEVDDVMLCESNAFTRYLAYEFGYGGKTALDKARVDQVIDSLEDALRKCVPVYAEQDPIKKAELQNIYKTESVEPFLPKLCKLLESNHGGDGFFVGDSVTLADLAYINLGYFLFYFANDFTLLDKFPKLKALKQRVEAIPAIASWIKERPQTDL